MTVDLYADFKEDQTPSNLDQVLIQLADELQEAALTVENVENALELAKDKLKDITDIRVPAATDGLEGKFDLSDGRTMTVKETIRSSIAGEKRAPAIRWLDEHDYGHIVKRNLVFSFAKGDTESHKKFVEAVKKIKMPLVMKEDYSVHHMTLNSFVKEKLSEGIELPKDVFGIFRQRVAKVTE